jgi:hypothetical protein
MLGWANRGTLPIEPWIGYAIALVLFLPISYLMYSIVHFLDLLVLPDLITSIQQCAANLWFVKESLRRRRRHNVHLRISLIVDPRIPVSIAYRARRRGLRACLHLGALLLHGETRHATHLRLNACLISSKSRKDLQ